MKVVDLRKKARELNNKFVVKIVKGRDISKMNKAELEDLIPKLQKKLKQADQPEFFKGVLTTTALWLIFAPLKYVPLNGLTLLLIMVVLIIIIKNCLKTEWKVLKRIVEWPKEDNNA